MAFLWHPVERLFSAAVIFVGIVASLLYFSHAKKRENKDEQIFLHGFSLMFAFNAAQLTLDSPKTLREIGDNVRDRLGSGVAVPGGVLNDKAALLALVSKDLTGRIKAGDIVRTTAEYVGGKGGGRPGCIRCASSTATSTKKRSRRSARTSSSCSTGSVRKRACSGAWQSARA